jgi:hypothetical protein
MRSFPLSLNQFQFNLTLSLLPEAAVTNAVLLVFLVNLWTAEGIF